MQGSQGRSLRAEDGKAGEDKGGSPRLHMVPPLPTLPCQVYPATPLCFLHLRFPGVCPPMTLFTRWRAANTLLTDPSPTQAHP